MYGILPYIVGDSHEPITTKYVSWGRYVVAVEKSLQTQRAPKSERLEARVTLQQKRLLQRAAELRGLSLTDFLVTSAQTAAEAAIREHNVIALTAEDSIAFAEALLNPREPNASLRAAFARYSEEVADRD